MPEKELLLLSVGQPLWVQLLLLGAFVAINFMYTHLKTKRKTRDEKKDNKQLEVKSLLILKESETYHSEKYNIINRRNHHQAKTIKRCIQTYLNQLINKYEAGLNKLSLEKPESELLSLAFQGFLYRLKEETMDMMDSFLETKVYKDTGYRNTADAIKQTANEVHLFLRDAIKRQYKTATYKVDLPEDLIDRTEVVKTVEDIYTQAKTEFEMGENQIGDLKKAYDEKIKSIIQNM